MAFVERKWKLLDHFNDNNLCMTITSTRLYFYTSTSYLILCVEREQYTQ